MQAGNEVTHFLSLEKSLDFPLLGDGEWPKAFADWNRRADILDALRRQVMPFAPERLLENVLHRCREIRLFGFAGRVGQSLFIPVHHLFEDVRGGHARQIRTAGRGGYRKRKTDKVVRRIANHRLIEVSDFDLNAAFRAGHRSEISKVAVPANPYRRPVRNQIAARGLEPFVELDGVAANVGMR